MRHLDISTIQKILITLKNGEKTQKEIANETGIDESKISRYIKGLTEDKIIKVKLSTRNGYRVNLCSLIVETNSLRGILSYFRDNIDGYRELMDSKFGNEVVEMLWEGIRPIADQTVVCKLALKRLRRTWKLRIEVPSGIKLSEEDTKWIGEEFRKMLENTLEVCKRFGYPAKLFLECVKISPKALSFAIDLVERKTVTSDLLRYSIIGRSFLGIKGWEIKLSLDKDDLPPEAHRESRVDEESLRVPPRYNVYHLTNYMLLYPAIVGAALSDEGALPKLETLRHNPFWDTLVASFYEVGIELKEDLFKEGVDFRDTLKKSMNSKFSFGNRDRVKVRGIMK